MIPGLPGGSINYQGHLFARKDTYARCCFSPGAVHPFRRRMCWTTGVAAERPRRPSRRSSVAESSRVIGRVAWIWLLLLEGQGSTCRHTGVPLLGLMNQVSQWFSGTHFPFFLLGGCPTEGRPQKRFQFFFSRVTEQLRLCWLEGQGSTCRHAGVPFFAGNEPPLR